MRFFAALARHGSLSAAARALGVNHATVARRVAGLEETVGARLFERRPTGYELTAAGRDALQAAGAMETAARLLPRREASAEVAGLVRITATPTLAEAFLVPRLGPLQQHHPALDLEVIADLRAISLPRHEADVALRLARPQDGDLIARAVATLRHGFYGTTGWRDRIAVGETPIFVGFDEAGAHLPEAAWLARQFPTCRLAFRTNSQMTQAGAARAGCGIALLPNFLGSTDPGLVPVPIEPLPPTREIWLLTRRDVMSTPPIRTVTDFLLELFQRERAVL